MDGRARNAAVAAISRPRGAAILAAKHRGFCCEAARHCERYCEAAMRNADRRRAAQLRGSSPLSYDDFPVRCGLAGAGEDEKDAD